MRVIITKDRPESGGGIDSFFNNIREFFSVDYRYISVGRPMFFYGKTGFFLRFSLLRLLSDYLNLLVSILVFQPDIVHINSSVDRKKRSLGRDGLNILIAKLCGKKVLLFWHGFYCKGSREFPVKGLIGKLLWKIYNMTDIFMVLSNGIKGDLESWGFSGSVIVGKTAYDKELLQTRSSEKESVSILFLAAVLEAKGIFELVSAYDILRQNGVTCDLIIAGDGPDLEGVKAEVRKNFIPEVVFTGFVKRDEKKALYEKASIFCFPSYDEAMPVSVLEAMASGLPVVATRVGALNDMLVDGETGYDLSLKRKEAVCVPDPFEIAEKLTLLVKDKDAREKMGEYNHKYALKTFHPAEVAKELEAVYKRLKDKDDKGIL